MSKPRPILLVAQEPRRHTPAMQRAFDLARRSKAPVHVLLEVFDPAVERMTALLDFDGAEGARAQCLREGRAWVDALVSRWKVDGLRASGEALWSPSVHRTIVQRALDLDARLVVKDASRVVGARRLLFGVLEWKLVRYCPAPLMLVRSTSTHAPERILAAVDTAAGGDPINARIVEAARALGRQCRAAVHLAHAFSLPPTNRGNLELLFDRLRDDDAAAFRAFARARGVTPSRSHFATGEPAIALTRLARSLDIDLVVLGSAHRSALDHLFLGSTAAALVRELSCDLLLVKPAGFAAQVARVAAGRR